MKLFHSSRVAIEKPKIRYIDRYLDFGYGFYMAMNKEQVIREIEKQRKEVNTVYISMYDFDSEIAESELKIIRFDKADERWLDFVTANRRGQCHEKYDIAIGPVADDSVYEILIMYETGFYDLEEILKRLKTKKLYHQVMFHSEKSLMYLKLIGTEEK